MRNSKFWITFGIATAGLGLVINAVSKDADIEMNWNKSRLETKVKTVYDANNDGLNDVHIDSCSRLPNSLYIQLPNGKYDKCITTAQPNGKDAWGFYSWEGRRFYPIQNTIKNAKNG